jgi:hypothetical protein
MCLLELLRLCKEITVDQGFTGGFMSPYGFIPSPLSGGFVGNEEGGGMGGYGGVEGTRDSERVAITGEGILVMEEMGGKQGTSTE